MFEKYLNSFEVLSVVGMCKNAGKTTVVNKMIESLFTDYKLGITSIGIDGETIDLVTDTEKPEIYVAAGTLIATAKSTLSSSDITYKVKKVFDFTTPLGKIILVEAMSDGFVKIAGPSFNSQLEAVIEEFKKQGTNRIIVDGAASRKQLAKTSICDALILATGASYNSKLTKVINDTRVQAELLNLGYTKNLSLALKLINNSKLGFIYQDSSTKSFDVELGFESVETVISELTKDVKAIVINGAITDTLLKKMIENIKITRNVEVIVSNPVNVIASPDVVQRFFDAGLKLTTVKKSELLFVSINPISAYGYSFDAVEFKKKIENEVKNDVINVIGGWLC